MCHSLSLVWNLFQFPDSTPTNEQTFYNLGFGDDGNLSLFKPVQVRLEYATFSYLGLFSQAPMKRKQGKEYKNGDGIVNDFWSQKRVRENRRSRVSGARWYRPNNEGGVRCHQGRKQSQSQTPAVSLPESSLSTPLSPSSPSQPTRQRAPYSDLWSFCNTKSKIQKLQQRTQLSFPNRNCSFWNENRFSLKGAAHRGHLHEWKAKRLLVKNCAKSGLCGGRAELLERLCYADFNLFQRVSLLLFEVMLCWCDEPARADKLSLVLVVRLFLGLR